jgi:hypothetical protein
MDKNTSKPSCILIKKIKAVYKYFDKGDGRYKAEIHYIDGTRKKTNWSRYILGQHLGRELDPRLETVDHINRIKTDDRIENLRLISLSKHLSEDNPRRIDMWFECPICKIGFSKKRADVRYSAKKGRVGPFCNRKCAAIHRNNVRFKNKPQLPKVAKPPIEQYYLIKS